MSTKVAFVFCEHYAIEARSAIAAETLANAVVAAIPARCGRPPLTSAELAAVIEPLGDVQHIEIFGGCCLNNLSEYFANGYCVHIHKQENCFNLIAAPELISGCLKNGAYLTTPDWLVNWPANMKHLGLDQETAREMFSETTNCIVLLDTGIDTRSAEQLLQFAEYVARPHETLYTGIALLRLLISKTFQARQYEDQLKKSKDDYRTLQQQAAMSAMAIDLLTNLASIVDQEHAIEGMLDVYSMLFAPQKINYLDFHYGRPDKLWTRPPCTNDEELNIIRTRLTVANQDCNHTESGRGFILRIVRRELVIGVIEIDDVAFPEHIDQYLNQAMGIANISVLPIDNARKYQRLVETEDNLRKANQQLVQLATTDPLTGIANRRSYDVYIEKEWKRMLRENTPLSLIICDIDFFKNFNDHYGHKAGDVCLQKVAQTIHDQALRPGDVAARYGGEEFVIILPATTAEGAYHIAERTRLAVEQQAIPHDYSEVAPYVTISVGVSQITQQEAVKLSISSLFHAADVALYNAKKQGRNRSVIHKKTL